MSRADDLTALLAPPRGPEVGIRQGSILTFDPVTRANTVRVAGGTLTNLPILSGAEPLVADDVVILMRVRSSWFVLGRIITPA